MFATTKGRLGRAAIVLLATVGLAAAGAASAGAVPPGWQSGWKPITSVYGKGCNAKVFYGRTLDGHSYAYMTSTNPACVIQVAVNPVIGGDRAESNWGQGTVGAVTPGTWAVSDFAVVATIWIPAYGVKKNYTVFWSP